MTPVLKKNADFFLLNGLLLSFRRPNTDLKKCGGTI